MTSGAGLPTGRDRPDVKSRDIVVLAKLVRTLSPLELVLFGTPYARESGWTAAAVGLLERLKATRPEILGDFRVIDLPQGDLPVKLAWFEQKLREEAGRIQKAKGAVAFDCTTGQSIFHVLGFDAVRQIGEQRGLEVSTAYLDADTRNVFRSTPCGGVIRYDQQPTAFHYQQGMEVAERFGMYGVVPEAGRGLWPDAGDDSRFDLRCRLYDALCGSEALRALFHSYHLGLRRWKQGQIAAGHQGTADLEGLVERAVAGIATWVSTQTRQSTHQVFVRRGLGQVLKLLAPKGDAAGWLEHYLADKRLSRLRREFSGYAQGVAPKLLPGLRDGKRRGELGRELARRLNQLAADLRQALDAVAQSIGHDPSLFSPEDHRAFREQQILHVDLPVDLKDVVLQEPKLPDLFEQAIGCAVARAAGTRFRDSVAAVVQNLKLVRDGRPIAELDTLILLKNADVSVLEAKTHFANAQLKKIEANIKGLRDFGGAHSLYSLVYPLTGQDLRELAEGAKPLEARWKALGMEDVAEWRQYLKQVGQTRDQRVIGLDEVEWALRQG